MCSDPQSKTDRDTGEVQTYACRRCDQCVATRRHGWVARAMAEKTDWPHAACITLTYSQETAEGRDAARMFCYAHVSDFLKRLRSAAAREAKRAKWNFAPVVRFLCAGEQGDRNGRCHWHLILYSNFDLARLGQFRRRGKLVSHRRDMITEGKRKRRLNWTLWNWGYMTLQVPDQAAMSYVLSYCLKDQFTHEKSKGTMREASSENFATGLFRMSKRPAIGENFLMRKMEALDAVGAVLPNLQIRVPDFGGYWQPSGSFREKLLWCLVALNKRALWSTGANAPQWASLVSSCRDSEADLGVLNGPQVEKINYTQLARKAGQRLESWAEGFAARERDRAARSGPCYCQACLDALSETQLETLGLWRVVKPRPQVAEYRAAAGSPVGAIRAVCKYASDYPEFPSGVHYLSAQA